MWKINDYSDDKRGYIREGREALDTSTIFDSLLSRINFDGRDPDSFTLGELRRAIPRYMAKPLTPAVAPDGAGEALDMPDGATHMRRPEYITAWLFDRVSTMPIWLIEKYKSDPLPNEKIGHYATAIDGEFWRWFDPAKFEEMFIALTPNAGAGENDWPPQFELMKLQARKPDGGDWIDIFPAQLGWVAKAGHDVRALAQAQQPGEDKELGSSEPLGPHYDGTTMDKQQLHGTTRRNQPVVTAGETATPPPQVDSGREAREKEITRLATIEECAKVAEFKFAGSNLNNIGGLVAADIRALALRPERCGGRE